MWFLVGRIDFCRDKLTCYDVRQVVSGRECRVLAYDIRLRRYDVSL